MKIKTLIIGLFSFILLSSNTVSANVENGDPGRKYSTLRVKMIEKVESIKDHFQFKANEEAHVCFRVETDGTITVQKVVSKNKQLVKFLNTKLDAQTLEINNTEFTPETDYWITIDYAVL